MSSFYENCHGIVGEPAPTCPHVDEVQRWLKDAYEQMEVIRENNEKLREWGTEWRDAAIEYAKNIENLEEEIENLKSELKE